LRIWIILDISEACIHAIHMSTAITARIRDSPQPIVRPMHLSIARDHDEGGCA
jgi:hypothetical protein